MDVPAPQPAAHELPPLAWIAVGAGIMLLFFLALGGGVFGGVTGFFPLGLGFGWFGLGLLGIAVVVLCAVVTAQAHQSGRSGWWVYLICLFISPLNVAAVVAWFAHLKDHPWKWSESITV